MRRPGVPRPARGAAVALGAVLALAAAGGAPGAGPVPPRTGPSATADADTTDASSAQARAVLRRAEERYRDLASLRGTFHETVEVPLLDRERSGRGTWYQEGRGLFKLDYSEPPEDVVVSDGTHVWTYYPSSQPGQVTRTALEKSDRGREMVDLMGRIFRESRRGYRARLAGREEVGGVVTDHVVLTPTDEAPYREVELWIGVDDRLVRRFEVTEENRTVRTVTLTGLEPDVPIPDSVFEFEVPDGVEVFSG